MKFVYTGLYVLMTAGAVLLRLFSDALFGNDSFLPGRMYEIIAMVLVLCLCALPLFFLARGQEREPDDLPVMARTGMTALVFGALLSLVALVSVVLVLLQPGFSLLSLLPYVFAVLPGLGFIALGLYMRGQNGTAVAGLLLCSLIYMGYSMVMLIGDNTTAGAAPQALLRMASCWAGALFFLNLVRCIAIGFDKKWVWRFVFWGGLHLTVYAMAYLPGVVTTITSGLWQVPLLTADSLFVLVYLVSAALVFGFGVYTLWGEYTVVRQSARNRNLEMLYEREEEAQEKKSSFKRAGVAETLEAEDPWEAALKSAVEIGAKEPDADEDALFDMTTDEILEADVNERPLRRERTADTEQMPAPVPGEEAVAVEEEPEMPPRRAKLEPKVDSRVAERERQQRLPEMEITAPQSLHEIQSAILEMPEEAGTPEVPEEPVQPVIEVPERTKKEKLDWADVTARAARLAKEKHGDTAELTKPSRRAPEPEDETPYVYRSKNKTRPPRRFR